MLCEVCQKLEEELQHAWRFHAQILKVLKASTPAASDDYRKLQALEENLRLDMDAADRQLKQHEREHALHSQIGK